MKVSFFVPLVFSTAALAATRRSSYNPLTARQVQVKRDGLLDVCASINLGLNLLDILPHDDPLLSLDLNVCLCLSLLDDFFDHDPVGQKVSQSMGDRSSAKQYVSDAVQNDSNRKQCSYPDHCDAACDDSDPCHFNCKDGYEYDDDNKPTQCVCREPYTECNGKCGDYSYGCSSQAASHKRAPSYRKRHMTCAPYKDICGIPGSADPYAYDCVDFKNDPYSCGGCVTPNPFQVQYGRRGQNCHDIPNAISPSCESGYCVVRQCQYGYVPSPNGDSCVSTSLYSQSKRDVFDVTGFLGICVRVGLLPFDCDTSDLEVKIYDHVSFGEDVSKCTDDVISFLFGLDVFVGVHSVDEVRSKLY